jgi:AsmA family protein
MTRSQTVRRILKWMLTALAVLIAALLLIAAALDAGMFHGPLVRIVAAKAGRQIKVDGSLRVHLLSRNPTVVAERVTIGNPAWTRAGITAEVGKITVVFQTPYFGRSWDIERLELESAVLSLLRDSNGYANWQQTNPDQGPGSGPPLIRALSVPRARVTLDDDLRHLQFDGTVDVGAKPSPGPKELRVEGNGQLNGRPVTIELGGDALATADRDKPYHFTFTERSSGSHLTGGGALLHPFNLKMYDLNFEGGGADLKDLRYLIGLGLIDTGSYQLSGKLARRVYHSMITELVVTSGQSTVRGDIALDRKGGWLKVEANLNSPLLRLSDLGRRAAGRDPQPQDAKTLLLSDAAPNPAALRRKNAVVNFRIHELAAGRIVLHGVSGKVTIDDGVLRVDPLSADALEGKANMTAQVDARAKIPTAKLDFKIVGAQLGEVPRSGTAAPAIEGPLTLQAQISGQGKSLHQMAASANGTLTASLPSGTIRDSLAELTGLDLRGLGLLITKSKKEAAVRCGVANFQAHDGVLTAERLIIDTDPVLITGEGTVQLDTETIDFALHGEPKGTRILRMQAPVLIRGTLKHPSVGIEGHDARLKLLDRGHAKDADCSGLMGKTP